MSLTASTLPFYLGTYSDDQPGRGIVVGTLDLETGTLGALNVAAVARNPSYVCLSPDGKTLYAAMEAGEGALGAYRRESDQSLTLLNTQDSGGRGACHVSTNPGGTVVFVANYGSGSIASFPVNDDGSLGARASCIQFEGAGPHPKRQTSPHAHAVVASPDGRHAYACDLGTDRIWIFDINAETAELVAAATPFATIRPGGGPRHIVFSHDGSFAWVNHEMGLATTAFARDAETGALTEIASTPIHRQPPVHPESLKTSAILLHPSEKYLYVTNRGDDIVAVYSIGDDGSLTLVQNAPAHVKTPRGAAIDPTGQWFLVGGQDDGSLTVLAIDPANGTLSPTEARADVPKPVCVAF